MTLNSIQEHVKCKALIRKSIGKTGIPFRCSLTLYIAVIIIDDAVTITVGKLNVARFRYRIPVEMVTTFYLICLPDAHHFIVIDYTNVVGQGVPCPILLAINLILI